MSAAPATTVLLIRHGLTPTTGVDMPGRLPGLHLSDAGRAQARGVVERLAGLPRLDAVWSSPLERARETAVPLALAWGLTVVEDERLLEVDVGSWAGRPLAELRATSEWGDMTRDPAAFRFPGGETYGEVQARMAAVVAAARSAHPGGVVAAFSHADPIRVVAIDVQGSDLSRLGSVNVSPASVTVLCVDTVATTLLTLSSTTGDPTTR